MQFLSKKPFFFMLFIVTAFAISLNGSKALGPGDVATTSKDINVTGKVNYAVTIIIRPEKRIPLVGNWDNINTIEVRNIGSRTPLVTQIFNTNDSGSGVLSPVEIDYLPRGNYDIAIKGRSHLKRVFKNKTFYENTVTFDLTNEELLAGDTSVFEDNYVNSLDIANSTRNLYTNDNRTDLNHDQVVNALDMASLINNLYKEGDK